MVNKKLDILILVFAVVILVGINYGKLDSAVVNFFEEKEVVVVERVIDGDTFVANNESVRLLGINCPERGEIYYSEAKDFLDNLILGKKVVLKFGVDKKDLYGRKLAYVFYNNENVNKKLVEEGYANIYFLGRDQYYFEFLEAWKNCGKNLCVKSLDACASCVNLKKLDYENEIVVFENICGIDCDLENWEVKDEGRKKFIFPNFILDGKGEVSLIVGNKTNTENEIYWDRKDYVWTDGGDTLFLRDDFGKLVLWKSY